MKNRLRKALLAAFTAIAANASQAGQVMINEVGLGNGLNTGGLILPVQSGTSTYWAGLQNIQIDGATTFAAFCVDPWEWSPNTNTAYANGNLDALFGSSKANTIRELYSEAYAGTLLTGSQGNLNAAAFQLALWEIIADNDKLLNNTGLVQSVNSTRTDLLAATNALLSHLDGNFGSENYSFTLYVSGKSNGIGNTLGKQDYLVVNRIPEPSMALLMASALAAAGLISRRRRHPCTDNRA